jgi:membrane protease subunit (stomatin/prohibitin family)
LGKFTRTKLNDEFKTFGFELTKFVIENISLPQDVEAAMDKRTSMGVIGDVGRYAQFQAADAMRDAAQNPSGGAGTGMGLGAGIALGNAMAGAMSDAVKQPKEATTQAGVPCPKCGHHNAPGAKFCVECGTKQGPATCANCQAELSAGSKFCNECGQKV